MKYDQSVGNVVSNILKYMIKRPSTMNYIIAQMLNKEYEITESIMPQ